MEPGPRRWVAREELHAWCGGRLAAAALPGLWVAGSLDGLYAPCVAVVGSRAPSDDGRRRARRLAEELARSGVCVISGLALGVDGAAHEGALAAGAPTIAVLGGGHEHVFPPRHRELAARVATTGGAVVSPFEPENIPQPWQFLARNGVIAALADAVVVVEAAARSGALNTAGHAADLGRPVLAFPGDVERPKAAGCNALIRDGAVLVRHAEDVLGVLGIASAAPRAVLPARRFDDPLEAALVKALSDQACDLDLLCDLGRAAAGETLAALVRLEIAGAVERSDAGSWKVRSSPAPKARRGSPPDR